MPELTLITIKNQKQNSPCRFLSISRITPLKLSTVTLLYKNSNIYMSADFRFGPGNMSQIFYRSSQSGHILLNCVIRTNVSSFPASRIFVLLFASRMPFSRSGSKQYCQNYASIFGWWRATSGNRTQLSSVTGWHTNRYTNMAVD